MTNSKLFAFTGIATIFLLASWVWALPETCTLDDLLFTLPENQLSDTQVLNFEFQGYSNHWDRYAYNWNSYCGVFLSSHPNIKSELWKLEMDIGNELLLDELWMQKGFISKLAETHYATLHSSSEQELETALAKTDVLYIGPDRNPVIEKLLQKLPEELQFRRNQAFFLQNEDKTLFVIASHTQSEVERLYHQVTNALAIIQGYSLFKGWAGVNTNYLLITTAERHNPYGLINRAMQIGCSWIMVSGYNDYMLPPQIAASLTKIDFPFIFLPGQYGTGGVMYGMDSYPNIQDNTVDQCLDWTKKNGGFYFSHLSSADQQPSARYSGYVVNSSNDQAKIDSLNAPFITNAGPIGQKAPPAMIVFMKKNEPLTGQSIMDAILDHRAVAVFDHGQMLGPKNLREGLKILLLERTFLQKTLGGDLSLDAKVIDNKLYVQLHNRSNDVVNGELIFKTSKSVMVGDHLENMPVTLSSSEYQTMCFPLNCTAQATGEDNPIGVLFQTPTGTTRALTHFEVPRTVEMLPMILDVPGEITCPLTIHNYSEQNPVRVEMAIRSKSGKLVPSQSLTISAPRWHKVISSVKFRLDVGEYKVTATALGDTAEGIISIHSAKGQAAVHEEDMNDDGIPEIVMENSKIRTTVLLFGGRVIEYILKSRSENLLFKLWPEKPPWAGQPRGVRAFYPYGGLEEFIGYPYIGGHIVYNYEIQKQQGIYVRVRVWANIHGSKIEKTITLFGDSEVLEVRYALNDMVGNIHVIGINPLIHIGPSTGPEDEYYFPAEQLEKRSPVLERYYGGIFDLQEGWAAGYDTKEDISLIIGYPVNDAMFLHLWNNHPNNTPTPYFYTELQPWLKIKHGTTTYFSYYLFGQDGDWKSALDDFRRLGLVTVKKKN